MNYTVKQAQDLGVCRICNHVIPSLGSPGWKEEFGRLTSPVDITLDYGKEFAHTECLTKSKVGEAAKAGFNTLYETDKDEAAKREAEFHRMFPNQSMRELSDEISTEKHVE